MTEPIGTGGLVDTETALRREVDVLTQRFPQLERDELERYVQETYAELKRDAEVEAHLFALTRARVTEKAGNGSAQQRFGASPSRRDTDGDAPRSTAAEEIRASLFRGRGPNGGA